MCTAFTILLASCGTNSVQVMIQDQCSYAVMYNWEAKCDGSERTGVFYI